ncbi:hypothetical protein [Nocardioides terrigena]|uniref:hypothetical protein n=1 Tax=Nocardioides terrigena TaxID=424797 RepID=UPI000D2F9EFC|nr:hypothetical protein [Nocardioides terrigena]
MLTRFAPALALAASTLLVPAQAPATATAVPASRAVVAAADVPSVAAVARVIPYYRGGGREVWRASFPQVVDTDDCVTYTNAQVRSRGGKLASYTLQGGQIAYFSRKTSVTSAVVEYAKPTRAQAALEEQKAHIKTCLGNHSDDLSGKEWSLARTPAKFGQDAFTYRLITSDPASGRDWFVHTVARQGRRLVSVGLQRDHNVPATQPAFQLLAAALRTAR